jgi:ankyrin repeat protein
MRHTLRPTSHLLDLIRRRDWHLVRLRIRSHPNDAHYKKTMLHQACLYRAPLDVMELLLQATPPDAIVAQDSQGWTPLHMVLLYGAKDDICLLLIRRGGTLGGNKDGEYIGSPLHLACRHGASTIILKALLQADPTMAVKENEAGAKPANLLWHQFRKQTGSDYEIDDLQEEHVQDLLHRMGWIVDAARGRQFHQERNSEQLPAVSLHDVIDLHSELRHFISIMIRLYPEQCRRRDDQGNLPLHVAASVHQPCQEVCASLSSFRKVNKNNIDALDQLLHAYPPAANIPDGTGRLPLHLAVNSGSRTWKMGIASLVQASPRSITTRNVLTHLYPAQEAAHDVETSYELLKAWPPLVVVMTSSQ